MPLRFGRLFLTLVAALAQWERENLAERVRFGMEEMVRQGKRPGGSASYGYKSVEGKLIPVESEATIVRELFDRYEKNQGIREIQRWLEDEKIPAPKKKWSTTTINYILRSPIYIGKIRWNLRKKGIGKTNQEIIVDGNHEPIISENQFFRVQKILDQRKSVAPVVLQPAILSLRGLLDVQSVDIPCLVLHANITANDSNTTGV
ncbi:Recombinase [Melghirimyces algeriensis]|uniref:Recombinase n=2 Tax=Melghirimyces algeriensis TaxID=910412 RepID=A0A521CZK4_9BACL|nr:recombinase family protein [Melghirimyces algeriensis]SMO64879.1 Recombinase [Melghirimyces algeriensis]